MIPNSGKWNQTTDVREYIKVPLNAPPNPSNVVHNVSLGPFGIGDSRGRLDARYWLVTQVGGKVFLQFSMR